MRTETIQSYLNNQYKNCDYFTNCKIFSQILKVFVLIGTYSKIKKKSKKKANIYLVHNLNIRNTEN